MWNHFETKMKTFRFIALIVLLLLPFVTGAAGFLAGHHAGYETGLLDGSRMSYEAGYRKGACVTVHRTLTAFVGPQLASAPMSPCTAKEWSEPETAREQ